MNDHPAPRDSGPKCRFRHANAPWACRNPSFPNEAHAVGRRRRIPIRAYHSLADGSASVKLIFRIFGPTARNEDPAMESPTWWCWPSRPLGQHHHARDERGLHAYCRLLRPRWSRGRLTADASLGWSPARARASPSSVCRQAAAACDASSGGSVRSPFDCWWMRAHSARGQNSPSAAMSVVVMMTAAPMTRPRAPREAAAMAKELLAALMLSGPTREEMFRDIWLTARQSGERGGSARGVRCGSWCSLLRPGGLWRVGARVRARSEAKPRFFREISGSSSRGGSDDGA
jgi:hypothetical protein